MHITLKYWGQIKQVAGKSSESLDLKEGENLKRALVTCLGEKSEELKDLTIGDGELRSSILFFSGDEQIDWSSPPTLKDGDVLTLMSPIAGG